MDGEAGRLKGMKLGSGRCTAGLPQSDDRLRRSEQSSS